MKHLHATNSFTSNRWCSAPGRIITLRALTSPTYLGPAVNRQPGYRRENSQICTTILTLTTEAFSEQAYLGARHLPLWPCYLQPAVNRQPMFPRGGPEELAASHNALPILAFATHVSELYATITERCQHARTCTLAIGNVIIEYTL